METVDLDCWRELEDFLNHIDQSYRSHIADKATIRAIAPFSPGGSKPLYRGHADANWPLSTTLERIGYSDCPLECYYRRVRAAHSYLSGFTGRIGNFDPNLDISWESVRVSLPNYGVLAYLRHHGFPSPLLDWTTSPYVGLFFAFSPIPSTRPDRVALFCFQEYVGKGKSIFSNDPCIFTLGPWAATHPRHYLQQCEYTFCAYEGSSRVMLASHEKGFSPEQPLINEQDKLIKVTLPATERDLVLHNLFRMNVTPYSIFQSEDSLVQTVSQRLFSKL